jgi:hypothetical protein
MRTLLKAGLQASLLFQFAWQPSWLGWQPAVAKYEGQIILDFTVAEAVGNPAGNLSEERSMIENEVSHSGLGLHATAWLKRRPNWSKSGM